ncbi:hypothetical protein [Microseira wollei]|uniref:Uncharacterized protein n=1 Tax=Microseira wollei NIES-4236 TaxID=2530354 RepID=A0AAV3XKZ8_9CYAN|nr:hypothetical protein [Microseira wollei]GET42993.1 hypothetical protein MiSe_78130 [Microseira wollei NIES-4236]
MKIPVQFSSEIINEIWDAVKYRAVLNSKLISIGYRQEAASGNEAVFSWDAPLSASPKDRAFLKYLVEQPSATNIKVQLWQGDGVSRTTLTPNTIGISRDANFNNAVNINYSSNENFPIRWATFQSQEMAMVVAVRPDNNAGLCSAGFLCPAVKPTWWSNNSLYAFAPNGNDISRFRVLPGNPLSPNQQDIVFNPELFPTNFNPGGTRDLLKRLALCSSTQSWVVGFTSSDFGIIASNGLNSLSQLTIDGQTWVNVRTNAWSFAVRIA